MITQSLAASDASDTIPEPIACICVSKSAYVIHSYSDASSSFSTFLPSCSTQWRFTMRRLPAVFIAPPLAHALFMIS